MTVQVQEGHITDYTSMQHGFRSYRGLEDLTWTFTWAFSPTTERQVVKPYTNTAHYVHLPRFLSWLLVLLYYYCYIIIDIFILLLLLLLLFPPPSPGLKDMTVIYPWNNLTMTDVTDVFLSLPMSFPWLEYWLSFSSFSRISRTQGEPLVTVEPLCKTRNCFTKHHWIQHQPRTETASVKLTKKICSCGGVT